MDGEFAYDDADRLAGRLESIGFAPWQDRALYEDAFIEHALTEMELGPSDIGEAVAIRDQTHAAVASVRWPKDIHFRGVDGPMDWMNEQRERRRKAGLERFVDWYRGKDVEVVDVDVQMTRAPIFLLTAPAVPGCSTEFVRGREITADLSWELTLFGNGLTGKRSYSIEVASTFGADAGATREVFVPVRVETRKIRIQYAGWAGKVERTVSDASLVGNLLPGVRTSSLAADQIPRTSAKPQIYPLKGASPTPPSKYEFSAERTDGLEVSVGFKAFNTDHTLTGSLSQTCSMDLTCVLTGGYDYEAYRTSAVPGITWSVA